MKIDYDYLARTMQKGDFSMTINQRSCSGIRVRVGKMDVEVSELPESTLKILCMRFRTEFISALKGYSTLLPEMRTQKRDSDFQKLLSCLDESDKLAVMKN